MAWTDGIIPSFSNNYARVANANARPYSGIVMHVTGKQTLADELNWMKTNGQGLGYHYVIDRDGKVYQTAPLDKRMNQVIADRDKSYNNNNSLGVAMVAGGKAGEEPPAFSDAQLSAGKSLVDGLRSQYNIPTDRVVGHGQIQADREAGNKLNAGGGYEAQSFMDYYGGGKGAPASTAAPATAAASPGGDRRTQVFQMLTGLGIQPRVALGAMASLAGESSPTFDPASMGDPHIPGGSVGIGQWNRERREGLNTYATSVNGSPGDFGTQLGYLKEELTNRKLATYQPGVLDALLKGGTTADGTKLWTSLFERPATDNSEQRMNLTSSVGSIDDKGNFVPGSGSAPSRPVTPTPGGTPPPGTTLTSNPSMLPGFTTQKASDKFKSDLASLGKASGGDQGQSAPQAPQFNPTPPSARNVGPLGGAALSQSPAVAQAVTGYAPQPYGNTLTSVPDMMGQQQQQPTPAPAVQAMGTTMNSMGNLQSAYGLSPQQLQMLMNPMMLAQDSGNG